MEMHLPDSEEVSHSSQVPTMKQFNIMNCTIASDSC